MKNTEDYTYDASYFVDVRIGLHRGTFQARILSDQLSPAEYVEALPQPYFVEVLVFDGHGWNTVRTLSNHPSRDENKFAVSAQTIRNEAPTLAKALDDVVSGLGKARRESPPEGCVVVDGREAARQVANDILQTLVDGSYMDAVQAEARVIQHELETADLPSWF